MDPRNSVRRPDLILRSRPASPACAGRSWWPIIFSLVLLTGCGDDPTEPALRGMRLLDVAIEPTVAVAGEPVTWTLTLHGATSPVVTFLPAPWGGEALRVEAYDDGTNGDPVAGDGQYTGRQFVLPLQPEGFASYPQSLISDLQEPDRPRDHNWHRMKGALQWVDTAVVVVPMVTELAPDARATDRVVALEVPDSTTDERTYAVRRYLELMPDDRDFLVVVSARTRAHLPHAGLAIHVRQDVGGIGASVGTNDRYGRLDRLQMIVELTTGLYATSSERGFCVLTHEMNHRWAAFVDAPLQRTDPHWNFNALARDSSAFGTAEGCHMNDLELYLAGLIPADSVAAPLTSDGYGIDDIISDHGVRRPAWPEAQRAFTIGFIITTDEPLADHEMAFYHHLAREYTARESTLFHGWAAATGGRSTLDGVLHTPSRPHGSRTTS